MSHAIYIRRNHLTGNKDYVWFFKKDDGWKINIGQNNNTKMIYLKVSTDEEMNEIIRQFPCEEEWSEDEDEEWSGEDKVQE